MEPIVVRPGEPGRLVVLFPYSPERVAKIKSVPGRRWHSADKHWSVPDQPGAQERLTALFKDETIETPNHDEPDILRRVRSAVRSRHFSPRTETAYVGWTRRFLAANSQPADTLREADIGRFLSSLAEQRVSSSTQNQAFNALLFLFKDVLAIKIGLIDGVVRAKKPQTLPVVLSKEEVRMVLTQMSGSPKLMATLLYGAGLRLMECCQLRIKDLDFDQNQIAVRGGKGGKDRFTPMPSSAKTPLQLHLKSVHFQHERDLASGLGRVELPNALARKYPNAPKEWAWQWVFPATSHYTDSITGERRRHLPQHPQAAGARQHNDTG